VRYDLQLTPFAKARVSWGESLTPGFSPAGVLSKAIGAATVTPPWTALTVGVEAAVYRGARVEYGLLGAICTRSVDARTRVEVGFVEADGPGWSESLAGALDQVTIGLSKSYASAVLDSVAATASGRLPACTFSVSEAASGAIGSSQRFFALLGKAVVELVACNDAQPTVELRERLRALLVGA